MEFVPNADQLAGIEFILQHAFGALFWDPGTRKTSTMLYAFKILRDMGLVRRALVVSEVNVVDGPWVEEIEKWDDLDLTYAQLRGSERNRRNEFDLDADIYLLNMENVEWFHRVIGKKPKLMEELDVLFVDESSKFRNRKTKRFRALRKMLPMFKRRYVATGTPTPKGYMNLWSQLYIADRGDTLGDSLTEYKLRYFQPGGFKGKEWFIREGAEAEIQRAIAPRVSRVEKHLNVSISFEDIEIKLPPKARRAYDELEEEFITRWKGETITAMNAAVATGKLRQAANGGVYYAKGEWTLLHRAKVDALLNLIKSLDGAPLLVAYEFKHDYEVMKKFGLDAPSFSEAKPAQRVTLKRDWNAGKLPVLLSQIASISHGQNVQSGGCNLAYYGLPFNLEDYEQFYQRLWRDGQVSDVRAWRLRAVNTVDDVAIDVLNSRATTQAEFLSAIKQRYKL